MYKGKVTMFLMHAIRNSFLFLCLKKLGVEDFVDEFAEELVLILA